MVHVSLVGSEESGMAGAPRTACYSHRALGPIPPIIVSLHSEDEEKVFLKASSGLSDVWGSRYQRYP
jgi:hypothetical protein